jgi:hypothetical protein
MSARAYCRVGRLLLLACLCWSAARAADDALRYPVTFALEVSPGDSGLRAAITVEQDRLLLQEVRLRAPADRYDDFRGDGSIERRGDRIYWQPPASGGTLRYRLDVANRRNKSGMDALVTDNWALFRLDDVFPPAAISQEDGAWSDSVLTVEAPADWAVVTPFAGGSEGGWQVINPARKFDRPTGWLAAGTLGIRRDTISGIRVTIAAPPGEGVQRVSMLALLRWTLPEITALLDEPPGRLTIVSAGDPMWRGGLSAPASLFVHAERPLLSENGTSALVHEVIHVLLPVPAETRHDWIDEGLAEYLTLRVLRDSGSISPGRYRSAIKRFRRRGESVDSMATAHAAGAVTARAVAAFHDLDRQMRAATDDRVGVPDLVTRLLREPAPVNLDRLRQIAAELAPGARLKALSADRIPGFD